MVYCFTLLRALFRLGIAEVRFGRQWNCELPSHAVCHSKGVSSLLLLIKCIM
jgi:hypothetical protein